MESTPSGDSLFYIQIQSSNMMILITKEILGNCDDINIGLGVDISATKTQS